MVWCIRFSNGEIFKLWYGILFNDNYIVGIVEIWRIIFHLFSKQFVCATIVKELKRMYDLQLSTNLARGKRFICVLQRGISAHFSLKFFINDFY